MRRPQTITLCALTCSLVSCTASGPADDLSGVVICDAKKGNVMQGGAEVSTARGLLISPVGRPSVTRNVNTIATNADLLNNGSCP